MTHEELLLLGERLRIRRNAIGLTQETTADKVGISLRFYQMIERGEKSVSLETLIGLSRVLGISIDYLLFGNLPEPLSNPVAEIWAVLSPSQRQDAVQILQLYAKACHES